MWLDGVWERRPWTTAVQRAAAANPYATTCFALWFTLVSREALVAVVVRRIKSLIVYSISVLQTLTSDAHDARAVTSNN